MSDDTPLTFPGGGTTEKKPTKKPLPKNLTTITQFEQAVKDAGLDDLSFFELLQSPLFTGPQAYTLSANLYKQIQTHYLNKERETGKPFIAQLGGGSKQDNTGSGGGGSGLSAIEQANIQSQIDTRAAELELARQRIAEERRQNLLAAALRLTETQVGERTKAREQSVSLAGNDPFRFLAQIHQQQVGNVQTPYDIFKGKLAQTATQQTPNIGPNSTVEDLESAIGKLQTPQTTPTPSGIGFAGGGTANMAGPYEARLVGEQGSYVAPGTEVMITGGGQTTIIPLGKGMQTGGTTSAGITDQSLTVLPQLFANLRRDVAGTGTAEQQRARLGFLPEGQSGGEPRFGQGYGALASPLSLKQGYDDLVRSGIISQPDADRIVGLIGMLPSPRAAAQWLANLTPVEKEAALSAYRLAGIPDEEFNAMVASSAISGPRREQLSFVS